MKYILEAAVLTMRCHLCSLQLQADAINAFGESLQKKLLDIEGLYSKVRSRYSFIQALVRRIRGLLRISRN